MTKINSLIITGKAGAGKDFYLDLLSEEILKNRGNPFTITFARQFKEIISQHIPQHIKEQFPNKDPEYILETLKNDREDIIVYENDNQQYNMRSFLQKLLGHTIRNIEPDIHAIFEINEAYNQMKWDKNTLFICSDNRYPNEQNYFIGLNLCNNHQECIDYCESVIHQVVKNINSENINQHFFEDFLQYNHSNNESLSFIENIKLSFQQSLKPLKLIKPRNNNNFFLDNAKQLPYKKMPPELFLDLGVINIFREAIPQNYDLENQSYEDIAKTISEHAHITLDKAEKLISKYEEWGLELNDLHKYGICRTNPTTSSELALENEGRLGFRIKNKGTIQDAYKDVQFIHKFIHTDISIQEDLEHLDNIKKRKP